MRIRFGWLALLGMGGSLQAQVDLGISGGVPVTPFILDTTAGSRTGSATVVSAPRRYTVGPFVELRVAGFIGIEASALYRRFGFDTHSTGGGYVGPFVITDSATRGRSWEFPVLAKTHLRLLPGVNAVLGVGPSIRHIGGLRESGVRQVRAMFPGPLPSGTTAYTTTDPPEFSRRTSIGATASAGIEFRAGHLRLAPLARFTRWDTERTAAIPSSSRLARTQADVALNVSWASAASDPRPAGLPGSFEAGVLAGVHLRSAVLVTDSAPGGNAVLDLPAHRLTAGALVDWRLRPYLSLEASFLARRFGHHETFTPAGYAQSISGTSWEVPLLGRVRVARVRSAALWLGAGPALRRVSHIEWIYRWNGGSYRYPGSILRQSDAGFALSAALDHRAGPVRLRPEIRFTRFARPIYDFGTAAAQGDSVALLLGVSWARRR